MKYKNFTFNYHNSIEIIHARHKYERTDSGKSWRAAPTERERKTVERDFYENFVHSIPFFNSFSGGKCRADYDYTPCGYIPVKITTISPDKATKYIDYFIFKEKEV